MSNLQWFLAVTLAPLVLFAMLRGITGDAGGLSDSDSGGDGGGD